jgi:hypothetical protein
MPSLQAPIAPALLLATKLVTLGRIVTRSGPIAHSGQFGGGEELKLSHRTIIAHPPGRVSSNPLSIMPISVDACASLFVTGQ